VSSARHAEPGDRCVALQRAATTEAGSAARLVVIRRRRLPDGLRRGFDVSAARPDRNGRSVPVASWSVASCATTVQGHGPVFTTHRPADGGARRAFGLAALSVSSHGSGGECGWCPRPRRRGVVFLKVDRIEHGPASVIAACTRRERGAVRCDETRLLTRRQRAQQLDPEARRDRDSSAAMMTRIP